MSSNSSPPHGSSKDFNSKSHLQLQDEEPFHLQPKKQKLSTESPSLYSLFFGTPKESEKPFTPPNPDVVPDLSFVLSPCKSLYSIVRQPFSSAENGLGDMGIEEYKKLLDSARSGKVNIRTAYRTMASNRVGQGSPSSLSSVSQSSRDLVTTAQAAGATGRTLTVASPDADAWCSRVSNTAYLSKAWLSNLASTFSTSSNQRDKQISQLEAELKFWEAQRKLSEAAKIDELEQRLACLLRTPPVLEDPYLKPQPIPQELPYKRPEKHALPVLSDDQVEFVMKTLRSAGPDTVLVNNYRLAVTQRELLTLTGTNWLSDMVINFYMQLLHHRSKRLHESNPSLPRVAVMNTFFYPKLVSGTGYAGVRRWTRSISLFDHDLVLIPIHDRGIHWCLAAGDLRKKTLTFYDSMGGENDLCLETLLSYLDSESRDKRQRPLEDMAAWKKINTGSSVPQQNNGCDCGVFLCTFAEFLSRDADFKFSQADMPDIRLRMKYEILTQQLLTTGTNLAPS
ncbi:unnamed protein product [Mesocestoides corti]|nr:unnamed protein product [Mesocestoides corti]